MLYDAAREAVSATGAESAKIVVLDSPGNLLESKTVDKIFVDGIVPAEFEHAGLIETSVMLALQPDRVREFKSVEAALPKLPYDVVPMPAGTVSQTGSFTPPGNATAAIGDLLLDDLVPKVAGVVEKEFGDRGGARAS